MAFITRVAHTYVVEEMKRYAICARNTVIVLLATLTFYYALQAVAWPQEPDEISLVDEEDEGEGVPSFPVLSDDAWSYYDPATSEYPSSDDQPDPDDDVYEPQQVSLEQIVHSEVPDIHVMKRVEIDVEFIKAPQILDEQRALWDASWVKGYTERLCREGDRTQQAERGVDGHYRATDALYVLMARHACVVPETEGREDKLSIVTKRGTTLGRAQQPWERDDMPRALHVFTGWGTFWQHYVADYLPRLVPVLPLTQKMPLIVPGKTHTITEVMSKYFGVTNMLVTQRVCAEELYFVVASPRWYYQCRAPPLVRGVLDVFAQTRASQVETVVYAGRPANVQRGQVNDAALAEVVRQHAAKYAPHARFVVWGHYGSVPMESREAWEIWSNASLVVGPPGGSIGNVIMSAAANPTLVEFVGTDRSSWGWNDFATATRADYWWLLVPRAHHTSHAHVADPDALRRLLEATRWTKLRK